MIIDSFQALAPAKINLFLHITGCREDGYHTLESMVGFVEDVGDEIRIEPAEGFHLQVQGIFGHTLYDTEDNLVVKAARLLAKEAGIPCSAAIHLTKQLPIGAGIGGGSSDAATTLKLLCALWKLSPEKDVLQRLAKELGADVPMCLHGAAAYVQGIGECITPLVLSPYHIVMVYTGISISTGEIYNRFSGQYTTSLGDINEQDMTAFLCKQRNDLYPFAEDMMPELQSIIQAITNTPSCLLARMSGSGSVCFGLYTTHDDAIQAAEKLEQTYPQAWVRSGILR